MPLDTSIPLSGAPVSLGNPMQMMGQLLQIRSMQDEQQQRQLQNATLQRTQQDDAAMRDAIAQHTLSSGFIDYDAAVNSLSSSGRGGIGLKLADSVADLRKKNEDTLKQSLDNTKSKLELATRIVQGIKEEGTQEAFDRGKQYLTSIIGADAANQIGDRYDTKRIDAALTWGRDAGQQIVAQHNMFAEAAKLRDQAATDKKNAPVIAEGWKKMGAQLFSYAKNDADWQKASDVLSTQGMPSSSRQMFADKFSPEAVGQAAAMLLTPKEKADIEGSAAGRAETKRHDLATEAQGQARLDMEDAVPDLNPEAKRAEAQRYAMTGQTMSFGMGKKAIALKTEIANMAADMYKGLDLPSQMAAYAANKKSLTTMQGQMDQVSAFEGKAVKNLQQFIEQAQKTVDTGSPYLNRPVRALSDQLMGSPQMSAYNAARQVMLPEFARINNAGSSLSGVLSDSARKEVEDLLGKDATLPQVLAVAKVLVNDAKNSKDTLAEQIKAISTRIATPPKGMSAPDAGASASGAPEVGQTVSVGGKRVKVTAVHPDGTFDGKVVP